MIVTKIEDMKEAKENAPAEPVAKPEPVAEATPSDNTENKPENKEGGESA